MCKEAAEVVLNALKSDDTNMATDVVHKKINSELATLSKLESIYGTGDGEATPDTLAPLARSGTQIKQDVSRIGDIDRRSTIKEVKEQLEIVSENIIALQSYKSHIEKFVAAREKSYAKARTACEKLMKTDTYCAEFPFSDIQTSLRDLRTFRHMFSATPTVFVYAKCAANKGEWDWTKVSESSGCIRSTKSWVELLKIASDTKCQKGWKLVDELERDLLRNAPELAKPYCKS